jgi:hypothetical protein
MEEYKHIDKKYLREVRKLQHPKRYRKRSTMLFIYRTAQVILVIFSIVAIIGIYGSLSGKQGEFWVLAETVGNIALILLIITIILYFAAKDDIRFDTNVRFIFIDKD